MKSKFTVQEKEKIVKEANNTKDKKAISLKYEIHLSTLYAWISASTQDKNRNIFIGLKLTKEENIILKKRASVLGYEKDISTYIRKMLFGKYIANGKPGDIIKELYNARGELNKIGNNINQVAHYTNFLANQGAIDDNFFKQFSKAIESLGFNILEHRKAIDKTIRKI